MPNTSVLLTSDVLTAEIAAHGAELRRLVTSDGRDLQWNGDPAVWSGRAPILFPVIGVLNGGGYQLDGRHYAMAKHGFARHATFAIVSADPGEARLRLAASDETRAIYPFEFQLDLVYTLAGATLTLAAQIANRGEVSMPASFGFHPALRWPLPFGHPRADHRIAFAQAEPAPIRRIDSDGLLRPQPEPTPVAGDCLTLRDALFVDDALIFDALASRELSYGARDGGPQLRVRFEDFPTLGVWTKPGAGFICIEPWQGIADPQGFAGDLHDKPGIVEIAPGTTKCLAMHIMLDDQR